MKQLLNTLYVQTEGAVLRLEHENVVVKVEKETKMRVPLHHLGSIVNIGRVSMTSPLLARCAADGRSVVYLRGNGKFQYRIEGPRSGNVLLRTAQHRAQNDADHAGKIVQAIVAGKIYNSRQTLLRCARETEDVDKKESLQQTAHHMHRDLQRLPDIFDINSLRGIEGINAKRYFAQFNNRIKAQDDCFSFTSRSRRPPRDPLNALLSFLYMLLLSDCTGAVEGVGLDPQVGFLHTLRPGRPSLALDLVEELRPVLADRLALTLVNRQQLQREHFEFMPGGAVHLNKKGKKIVISAYQQRKKDVITHQMLKEKMPIGLLVHVQARLLARAIRRDRVEYQPFLYK